MPGAYQKLCPTHIRVESMKKQTIITLFAIALATIGCGPKNPPAPNPDTPSDTTVVNPPDTVAPPDTVPEGPKVPFPSEGWLPAKFRVADNKYVYFSKGNLQFNVAMGEHTCADTTTQKGTWRFAERQYDCVYATGNSKASETYDGWIDNFAWGTSGWNSGAVCYQPWSISGNKEDYNVGNNPNSDLTGNLAFADWGVYNAISNGGNLPSQWRTLTKPEWQYLFRNTHWAFARVVVSEELYVNGMMFIPDGFTRSADINIVEVGTGNLEKNDASDMKKALPINKYTLEQFGLLEAQGCVLLPFADEKKDTYSKGYYWSASTDGEMRAQKWHVVFYYPYIDEDFPEFSSDGYTQVNFNDANFADRHNRLAVRLVVDARN